MEPYSVEAKTGLLVQDTIMKDTREQCISANRATTSAFGPQEAGSASSASWRVKRHEVSVHLSSLPSCEPVNRDR